MTKPSLPTATLPRGSRSKDSKGASSTRRRRVRNKTNENSDVLVSAVISSYLLTHLHHVLQRAEYGAFKDGRTSQAANFAQLRKVLCMDARSMKDASASGMREDESERSHHAEFESKVA